MEDFLRALYLEHAEYFDRFPSKETRKAIEDNQCVSREHEGLFSGEPVRSAFAQLMEAEGREQVSRCADCFGQGFRLGARLMLSSLWGNGEER